MGIGSMGRDENMLSFAIRFLIQMIMNFTMGLFGALVAFVWYLWDVISSYGANLPISLLFFTLAVLAASSFVASFLVAMYAAAAGTAYVAVKAAGPGALRIGTGRTNPRYIRGARYGSGFRPHQF